MNTTFRKMYTPEEIKAIAGGGGAGLEVIEITDVPDTATNGTLTKAQMAIVNSDTPSCIKFNNEYYYKMDEEHTEGIVVYSHTGYTETDGGSTIKYISITLATSAWTLTSQNVSGKLYMHKVVFKTNKVNDSYYYVICDIILPTPTTQSPINYFRKFKDFNKKNYYNCNICLPPYGTDPIPNPTNLIISSYIEITTGDVARTPTLYIIYKDLTNENWTTANYLSSHYQINTVTEVAVIEL